mgnify:CR=1 FL=1
METIYLEKCSICKSKDLHPEFGDTGELVCQKCGIIGKTETYSTKDIDEVADLLAKTSVKPQEQEYVLPQDIQDMLLEYELKEEMRKQEQTAEEQLEEELKNLQVSQKKPSKRIRL